MSASKDSNRLVCNFRMIECLKSTVMDVLYGANMISVWSGPPKRCGEKKTLGSILLNTEDILWMINIE